MELHGKVCVVTGASGGIGRELALELGRRGNKVTVLARRKPELEEVAHSVGVYGGEAMAITADIRSSEEIEAAFRLTEDRFGPVDLVIANAALNCQDSATEICYEDLHNVIEVNLTATMWTLNCGLRRMLPRRQGHLVGIASVAGFRGLPRGAAYAASKAGFRSYLESLRLTYARHGIVVTSVCPGFVRTPMIQGAKFPTPFCIESDDAALRILKAVERNRSEVVFPWQMAALVRLGSWTPNWLYDRLLARFEVNER